MKIFYLNHPLLGVFNGGLPDFKETANSIGNAVATN